MSIHSELGNLSAIVPQEWLVKLEQLSQETGCSIEELIQDALAQYLNLDPVSPSGTVVNVPLATIQKELATLTQKVNDLEQLFSQMAKLEAKMFSLEKTLTPERSTPYPTRTFTKSLVTDDDQDDEPDEILTDFLTE